ncbi:MAG: hypothetical protein AB7J30_12165 [Hyphomicrobium sp.]|uniref:hypothetical protein n=1 Tax=Hyphomicrobium sp. TaxID=82 RepID=UPI003D0BCEA5
MLACLIACTAPAHACWQPPPPKTVEEIGHVAQNQQRRSSVQQEVNAQPRLLALSDAGLKSAYGAGVLVGWGETGRRPDFTSVSAVGASALVAPFAFLGTGHDGKIADIFACSASRAEDMVERAMSYFDAELLEAIALKHEAGGRLVIALPGSAARKESIWDLGAIAASRHPQARRYIANLLLAAVDLTTAIDPGTLPMAAGTLTERNRTFRNKGAGERFLFVRGAAGPHATTYLIHNGVLFPDEGTAYMEARDALGPSPALDTSVPLVVPAYDFFRAAEATDTQIRIASPRPHLTLQPASDFDMSYVRALFTDAYRQARMGREWRSTFPDHARTYGP